MRSTRLEAFSDAVIAIIITIMVLEFEIPHEASWEALDPLIPKFLVYALTFVYLGIYWNNHHHMLQIVERVTGRVLWANLHLLFWLSLTPFVTAWMGENELRPGPNRGVRVRPSVRRDRLLRPPEGDPGCARPGLQTPRRARQGHQREDLSGPVRGGDRTVLREPVDRAGHLCLRCAHVARSGQAHRVGLRHRGARSRIVRSRS